MQEITHSDDNLLNFKQCSELVKLSYRGLFYWKKRLSLPFPQPAKVIGEDKYYSREDVMAWNAARKALKHARKKKPTINRKD